MAGEAEEREQGACRDRLAELAAENASLRAALARANDSRIRSWRAFDAATDHAVITTDLSGCITGWNVGAEHLFVRQRAAMLGLEASTIFTEEDRAAGMPARQMEKALSLGRATVERWFERGDGTRFFAIGELLAIRDDAGRAEGFIRILRDATEAHLAQLALRDSEAKFEAIVNSIDQMIWATQPDGYHDYYNQRWYDYTGVPEGSTDGAAWNGMFHPDDQERAWAVWRQSLETGQPYHVEYRLRHRSGQYRWVIGRAQPIRDAEGRISRWYGTCTDVHDLKLAEKALRESEARLRLTTESASIGTWDYNLAAGEMSWDARSKELFGLPPDAPVSYEDTFLPALHPDDRAFVEAAVARALAPDGPGTYDVEFRIISQADGVLRWLAATGRAFVAGGRTVRFLGTTIDISARKSTEAALAASEAALREESHALEILNRAGTQIAAELDLDRLVQTVVDAGVELTGAQFGAFFYNVIDAQKESYTLYALSGADRSAFAGYPMPRATQVFGPTFRGEGVVLSDDILADERYGKNPPYHGMPEGHLPVRSYLAVPVRSRSDEVIGGLFFGHERPGMFQDRARRLMSGLAAQAAIGIDNARLFQARQRLNETLEAQVEERTAERDRLWAFSEDLLSTADYEGRLLRVSPSWSRLLGHDEATLLSRPYQELIHPDDLESVMEQLHVMRSTGRPVSFEDRLKTAQGVWHWISWTLVPDPSGTRLHGIGRDVTEQKIRAARLAQAEEQLHQAQKMETVGQLTGGVAHDFNNLLQIVTGNLDILLRNLPPDAPRLRRSAENALTGAKRAAILTQRLLAFSRRQPLAPKPIEVNRLVMGMSDLLHRTLGETIEVETVLSPGLWWIEADPNQLENAILNLAVNARDAMSEGGRLTIETANVYLDQAYTAHNAEVTAGQYVVICVSDTGAGMDAQTVLRAFEPFFTTKEVGKGTGLGLSMVYGFVKQSGGHVKVYSEPGEGTTVKIYLARLLGGVLDEEEAASPIVPEGSQHETILVCEDDDDVRAYSVEVLRELGYRVLDVRDGPAALLLLQRREERVDLLFTDVVLPGGMTGAVLAERACQLRPGLKVLFTTGYARNAIVHQGRLDPGVELITKPFAYADLAARVRDILDARP